MSTPDHPDWWRPVGGANAQDSTLERRSTIWNDPAPIPPEVPPLPLTGVKDRAKFFPRGCRGKIEEVQVYGMRTAEGTLDVSLSPHPCIGPLYTITITPGATWNWYGTVFRQMWNYDSLFLWISRCDADVSWGRDQILPFDAHSTPDAGATWQVRTWRLYIRVVYDCETPGDVPVSGIVNNIPIPNQSSRYEQESKLIPMTDLTEVIRIDGAGYVDLFVADVLASANSHSTFVQVNCDGVIAFRHTFTWMNGQGFNDDTQPMSLPTYGDNALCVMMITKMFEFRREFVLYCQNFVAAQTVDVRVYPNLMR